MGKSGETATTSPVDATHLRRRRRRRALGVRCNDGCPATGARERREARGIGTEVGVAATDGGQGSGREQQEKKMGDNRCGDDGA